MDKIKVALKDINYALWQRGQLKHLLFEHQYIIYDAIWKAINDNNFTYVLNCARRFGKTTTLLVIAMEICIRTPKVQVQVMAPGKEEIGRIIETISDIMLETCPADLKPFYDSSHKALRFKNGSVIYIAGANKGQKDKIRGNNSVFNIVDEAGQIDDLDYIVKSVLIPMSLTSDGMTCISSTPSETPDHDYKSYYDEAKVEGSLSEFDVYDNTSITPEKLEKLKEAYGGENSTDWKREFLVQFVVDERLDIIPEWKDDYIGILPKDEYYQYYHKYECMDLGTVDLTAILYGHYDFRKGQLYIESEDCVHGHDMTTKKISEIIKNKEKEIWGNDEVYLRVADNNNPQMLMDLNGEYGLYFRPTLKDNLDAMINEVRLFIQNGRLIVNPNCIQMIGCLKYAIWDKGKSTIKRQFARSSVYGHYDALASLVYLIRNLNQHENPIPVMHNIDVYNQHIPKDYEKKQQQTENETTEALRKHFNI